jgi:hypothetical protein
MFGILFGLLGMDASANLRIKNAEIYKLWRFFISFALPVLEIFSFLNYKKCYLNQPCSIIQIFVGISLSLVLNFYFTKIAWSFCIRLSRSQEILIIHGKYLEEMMRYEDDKIFDQKQKQYIPAKLHENKGFKVHEISLISQKEDDSFFPQKKPNIFSTLAKN